MTAKEKAKAYDEALENIIVLNGIKYKIIPAKTNDKFCKDCAYYLDNRECALDECPAGDGLTILDWI